MKDECEKSYGRVLHLDLVLDNDDGEVYIKFDTIEAGKKAWKGLNGRMFGRRMVSADYMIEAMYNANFPKAKNL